MEDYPIVVRFPVHWGEMDALGHVNHARFPVWMETARLELFARIGLISEGQPEVGPILANLNINYRAPVHFPAEMLSAARIGRMGNSSFTMEYAIAQADNPTELIADGTTIIVLYDYRRGQTVAITDTLRNAIDALHRSKD